MWIERKIFGACQILSISIENLSIAGAEIVECFDDFIISAGIAQWSSMI